MRDEGRGEGGRGRTHTERAYAFSATPIKRVTRTRTYATIAGAFRCMYRARSGYDGLIRTGELVSLARRFRAGFAPGFRVPGTQRFEEIGVERNVFARIPRIERYRISVKKRKKNTTLSNTNTPELTHKSFAGVVILSRDLFLPVRRRRDFSIGKFFQRLFFDSILFFFSLFCSEKFSPG